MRVTFGRVPLGPLFREECFRAIGHIAFLRLSEVLEEGFRIVLIKRASALQGCHCKFSRRAGWVGDVVPKEDTYNVETFWSLSGLNVSNRFFCG